MGSDVGRIAMSRSEVLLRDSTGTADDSFPDDGQVSDHRPVRATIRID